MPRTFKGYPLVTSPGAGANLILVDAAAIAVADDGVELDVSDQAMVQMDDARGAGDRGDAVYVAVARQPRRHPRRALGQLESGDRRRAIHGDAELRWCMQPDDVAAAVVVNMRAILAPVQERIAVLRAKGTEVASLSAVVGHLRERLAVQEQANQTAAAHLAELRQEIAELKELRAVRRSA